VLLQQHWLDVQHWLPHCVPAVHAVFPALQQPFGELHITLPLVFPLFVAVWQQVCPAEMQALPPALQGAQIPLAQSLLTLH
jgi:hypothetical protein